MILRNLLFAALLGVSAPAAGWAFPTVGPSMDMKVVERTNAYRVSNGLRLLRPNPQLAQAAQAFADYYAANPGPRTSWGHEYDGRDVMQRALAAGYGGDCVGENLGFLGTTGALSLLGDVAQGMMSGWISSPPHQENLVHSKFDEIGVGSARFELDGFTWVISVQLFGCSGGARLTAG